MVMPYHLHMPSYFLETFTEYPYKKNRHPFFSVMPVFFIHKADIRASNQNKI